jgi:hypothetical protein
MVRGALVGLGGPWITAATGVFYAANMRRSTEAGSAYRFSCSPAALAVLTRLHASLSAGEVPADVSADDFAKVDFHMDFPDGAAKRLNPFGKGKGLPELSLGVVPLEGEGPSAKPGRDGWTAIIGCALLVVHARVAEPGAPRAALAEDAAVAAVADAMARGNGGKLRACVQWWLPQMPKAPAAKEGEPPPAPAIPPAGERAARDALSASMVSGFLPQTAEVLKGAGAPAPAGFFAWLQPEKRPGGFRVARRQLFEVGGVEPEYPYDELAALIDHLARLAA